MRALLTFMQDQKVGWIEFLSLSLSHVESDTQRETHTHEARTKHKNQSLVWRASKDISISFTNYELHDIALPELRK